MTVPITRRKEMKGVITRKLFITTVNFSFNDETRTLTRRFYGKTNGKNFMQLLMDANPEDVIKVHHYEQEQKVYQIEEDEFIKHAKELIEND